MLYLRSQILPRYVSEEDLEKYTEMGLLQFSTQGNLYNGTLHEAFQVMTALQTIAFIVSDLNVSSQNELFKYTQLFDRNIAIINYYGILFPFNLSFFLKEKQEQDFLLFPLEPVNEYII